MGAIVVVLLLALVLAAVIMLYVAYPYRGEDTPFSPLLGRAMRRGVDSLPTLDPGHGLESGHGNGPDSSRDRPVSIGRSMVDAQADGHR